MSKTKTTPQAETFAWFDGQRFGTNDQNCSGHVVYRFPAGIALNGEFTIIDGIMTVTDGSKKKVTQLGCMGALVLAEMLMGELVREAAKVA